MLTIAQARDYLLNDILHVGDDSYPYDRIDSALIRACTRFLSETGCTLTTTNVTLASGSPDTSAGFDPTSKIHANWQDDWFVDAHISNAPVRLTTLTALRRELEAAVAAGTPNLIAFEKNSQAYVSPTASTSKTLVVRHRASLITWTPGTMGTWDGNTSYKIGHVVDDGGGDYFRCIKAHVNQSPAAGTYWETSSATAVQDPTTSINIPDDWVRDVVASGGKNVLLHASVKRQDVAVAGQMFEELIQRARDHFQGTKTGVRDRNVRT